MEEQHRLWEILINEDINQYYFPTPDRIFDKNNLSKDNIEDLKKARRIFIEQLSDWEIQEPFYEKKIESIQAQDDSQKYTWSIFLKGTNTVIGQITCQPKDNEPENIRDVGWFIDSNYQHKGYGSKAAKLMLDYMFNEVGILKIETCVEKNNVSSYKIMEKLGFKKTNIIRKVKYTFASEEVECLCYEISHDEYLNGFKN